MDASDVVIVGGGAAGVAAAHALGRAGHRTVLLDDGRPRNGMAAMVTGLPWLAPEPPAALLDRAYAQLAALDGFVRVDAASVRTIEPAGEGFVVGFGQDRAPLSTRAVILATGVADELPDIPGIDREWGIRAFSCPYCHGHEARGSRVATLGAGVDVVMLTLHLARLTAGGPLPVVVTPAPEALPADAGPLLAAAGIEVRYAGAAEVAPLPDGALGIRVDDGVVACDVVFTRAVPHPRSALAAALGCALDDDGYVLVDGAAGRTSMPWVYAVGDLARSPYTTSGSQVLQAAASAAAAAAAYDQDRFFEALGLDQM